MSRYLTSRGAPWPNGIRLVQTFDTNFDGSYDESKPQNGLPWQIFPHQVFPWLASGVEDGQSALTNPDSFLMSAPENDGTEVPIKVNLQHPTVQLSINQEQSVILHRTFWDRYGVGDLATLMKDGSRPEPFCRLKAKHTPLEESNTFKTIITSHEIIAVDEGAKTITVQGRNYYRKRVTEALGPDGGPLYGIGNHMGMSRYLRDELSSDTERGLNPKMKLRSYSFGFAKISGFDGLGLYRSIQDFPMHDQRTGANPSNGSEPFEPNATSTHTLTFTQMPEGAEVGRQLSLLRRLPWVTTMLATLGTMAQRGGVIEVDIRLDWHARQFSSVFPWSAQRETNKRRYRADEKEVEFDLVEKPRGGDSFFNQHRPAGRNSFKSMLDYAAKNGLTPVMGHPAWTEATKQQHQVSIPPDHPHYVNEFDWHKIRLVLSPPGEDTGFPEGAALWYHLCQDGVWRFTCGEITSPDAWNRYIDELQSFICNPVDGGFVADMEFFQPNGGSDREDPEINFDIAYLKYFQFVGLEAGGAGLPAPDGTYPNGFTATPGDITGNSGTGTVTQGGGSTGSVGGGIPGVTPGGEEPLPKQGPEEPEVPPEPVEPEEPVEPAEPEEEQQDPEGPTGHQVVDKYETVGTRCDGGALKTPERP